MQKQFKNILKSGLVLVVIAAALATIFRTQNQAIAAPVEANTAPITALQPMASTMPTAINCSGPTGCDLYVVTGTLSLPGSVNVPIWGYSTSAAPGSATLPGPTIIATVNDTVNINLHNTISRNSSLSLPGVAGLLPDMQGAPALTGTHAYTFKVSKPGTSLYEAGLLPGGNGNVQVAMGMFGALVVRPAAAPNQATDDPNSAFNDEAVLIFSEIDPAFNKNPNATTLHNYSPRYWLINGKAYPNTANISSTAGNKVLLRYLNAGLTNQSAGTMNLHNWVYGVDGKALSKPYQVMAETVASGQSLDLITTLPVGVPAGTRYAVLSAGNHLDNNGETTATTGPSPIKYGGMLTFITAGTIPTGTTKPVVTNVAVNPNTISSTGVTLTLTAGQTLNLPVGSSFNKAEYFIDTVGVDGSGTSMTSQNANTKLSATIPITKTNQLPNGNHTIYVHTSSKVTVNRVTTITWGSFATGFVVINRPAVAGGPVITLNSLSPNPSTGSLDLNFDITASTTTTSNQNVTNAEFFLDLVGSPPPAGSGPAMTIGPSGPAPDTNFTATIPLASATPVQTLIEGVHKVSIRAKDAIGNWGSLTDFTFNVDQTAPKTSAITSAYQLDKSLKVTATVIDTVSGGVSSNIIAAEAFIDTVPANSTGKGIVMQPVSGSFSGSSANVYFIITPVDLAFLGQGQHTLLIHGMDAAGNWGSTSDTSATFIVDTIAPTMNASQTTLTAIGGGAIKFNLRATDPAPSSLITAVEYVNGGRTAPTRSGTLIPLGAYTPAPTLNVTVNVGGFTPGSHTIWLRARDAAGNWSTWISKTVTVS